MKSRKPRLKKRSSQDVDEEKSKSPKGLKAKQRTVRSEPVERALARIFVTSDVASAAARMLSASGFDVHDFEPKALEQALAKDDISCAVLWDDPENCLASAIAGNDSLESTVEDYIERAQELIMALRKNRRKLTLVDAGLLSVAQTDPAWNLFCSRLNLQTDALQLPMPLARQISVEHLLARLVVTGLGSLGDILEELRASSVSPVPADFSLAELAIAAADYARVKENEGQIPLLQNQVSLQDQEITRLTSAFAQKDAALRALEATHQQTIDAQARDQKAAEQRVLKLEAELTKATSDHARQSDTLAKAQAEVQTFKAQISQMNSTIERAQQERALLQTQVSLQDQEITRLTETVEAETAAHQMTIRKADQDLSRALADLRDEAKKRRGLEKQNDRLMRRVGDLNSKLDKLLVSTSWRVTRPMRAIKMRMVKGEKPIDILIAEERQREQGK